MWSWRCAPTVRRAAALMTDCRRSRLQLYTSFDAQQDDSFIGRGRTTAQAALQQVVAEQMFGAELFAKMPNSCFKPFVLVRSVNSQSALTDVPLRLFGTHCRKLSLIVTLLLCLSLG